MHLSSHNSLTVAGLRISDGEQHQILNELEANRALDAPTHNTDRRGSARLPLPPQLVAKLLIKQPGGTIHKFRVRARNLSNHGISILHGGFLHKKSVCSVEIFDGAMPLVKIPAQVVHCRYLRQTVHEIGLSFDTPIDAQSILRCEKPAGHAPTNSNPEPESLPRLRGRVLHVDPIEADRRYMGFRLAQLGLNFRNAQNTLEALEMANAQRFDLVLCEYRLKPDPAPYLVRRLRTGGFKMPIVVVGQNISRSAAEELVEQGAQACLSKPFKTPDLVKLMSSLLPAAEKNEAANALLSNHWTEEAFRPLIIEYVNELGATLDYINETIVKRATEADALQNTQQLAATAALYGFPQITEAAHELSTMLALDPLPTDMLYEQMIDLQKLAKAAQNAIG